MCETLDAERGSANPELAHLLDELQIRWKLQEQPFASHLLVIGPLIAHFREVWNSVSTKWYVRPLLQQQNRVNLLVVTLLTQVVEQLVEHDERMILQDRDVVALAREAGELQTRVRQLERRLAELEQSPHSH